MKPANLLRIASVLTFIHAILHTVGGVFGPIQPGPASIAAAAMKANAFPAFGHVRTFWEFYRGMGLAVSIFLTAEAFVFWQLAALATTRAKDLRPVLATFTVAYVAMAVNSYSYFFTVPVIVELIIAACLVAAIVTAGRSVQEPLAASAASAAL